MNTATVWTEQDSRALTVALVAYDGHRMPLRGDERRATIAAMAAAGLPGETIAHRLRISPDALRRFAACHGITLPGPANQGQAWWVAVADPRDTTEARRDRKRRQRERERTGTR